MLKKLHYQCNAKKNNTSDGLASLCGFYEHFLTSLTRIKAKHDKGEP